MRQDRRQADTEPGSLRRASEREEGGIRVRGTEVKETPEDPGFDGLGGCGDSAEATGSEE